MFHTLLHVLLRVEYMSQILALQLYRILSVGMCSLPEMTVACVEMLDSPW